MVVFVVHGMSSSFSSPSPAPPPAPPTSNVVFTAVRLPPNAPVLQSLLDTFSVLQSRSRDAPITGLYVATCVGSVHSVSIRLSNAQRTDTNPTDGTGVGGVGVDKSSASGGSNDILTFDATRKFEVLSLVGTVSKTCEPHLHISLGDSEGKVWGGHLLSASVFTTCEIVLGLFVGVQTDTSAVAASSSSSSPFAGNIVTMDRVMDERTGYKELVLVPGKTDLRRQQQYQHYAWFGAGAALGAALFAGGYVLGVAARKRR